VRPLHRTRVAQWCTGKVLDLQSASGIASSCSLAALGSCSHTPAFVTKQH